MSALPWEELAQLKQEQVASLKREIAHIQEVDELKIQRLNECINGLKQELRAAQDSARASQEALISQQATDQQACIDKLKQELHAAQQATLAAQQEAAEAKQQAAAATAQLATLESLKLQLQTAQQATVHAQQLAAAAAAAQLAAAEGLRQQLKAAEQAAQLATQEKLAAQAAAAAAQLALETAHPGASAARHSGVAASNQQQVREGNQQQTLQKAQQIDQDVQQLPLHQNHQRMDQQKLHQPQQQATPNQEQQPLNQPHVALNPEQQHLLDMLVAAAAPASTQSRKADMVVAKAVSSGPSVSRALMTGNIKPSTSANPTISGNPTNPATSANPIANTSTNSNAKGAANPERTSNPSFVANANLNATVYADLEPASRPDPGLKQPANPAVANGTGAPGPARPKGGVTAARTPAQQQAAQVKAQGQGLVAMQGVEPATETEDVAPQAQVVEDRSLFNRCLGQTLGKLKVKYRELTVKGRAFSHHDIYKEVCKFGGYEAITSAKQWGQCADILGIASKNSQSLQKWYLEQLWHMEQMHLHRKPGPSTPSPLAPPQGLKRSSPPAALPVTEPERPDHKLASQLTGAGKETSGTAAAPTPGAAAETGGKAGTRAAGAVGAVDAKAGTLAAAEQLDTSMQAQPAGKALSIRVKMPARGQPGAQRHAAGKAGARGKSTAGGKGGQAHGKGKGVTQGAVLDSSSNGNGMQGLGTGQLGQSTSADAVLAPSAEMTNGPPGLPGMLNGKVSDAAEAVQGTAAPAAMDVQGPGRIGGSMQGRGESGPGMPAALAGPLAPAAASQGPQYPVAIATQQQVLGSKDVFDRGLEGIRSALGTEQEAFECMGKVYEHHEVYVKVCELGGYERAARLKSTSFDRFSAALGLPSGHGSRLKSWYLRQLWHMEQVYLHRKTGTPVPPPAEVPPAQTTSGATAASLAAPAAPAGLAVVPHSQPHAPPDAQPPPLKRRNTLSEASSITEAAGAPASAVAAPDTTANQPPAAGGAPAATIRAAPAAAAPTGPIITAIRTNASAKAAVQALKGTGGLGFHGGAAAVRSQLNYVMFGSPEKPGSKGNSISQCIEEATAAAAAAATAAAAQVLRKEAKAASVRAGPVRAPSARIKAAAAVAAATGQQEDAMITAVEALMSMQSMQPLEPLKGRSSGDLPLPRRHSAIPPVPRGIDSNELTRRQSTGSHQHSGLKDTVLEIAAAKTTVSQQLATKEQALRASTAKLFAGLRTLGFRGSGNQQDLEHNANGLPQQGMTEAVRLEVGSRGAKRVRDEPQALGVAGGLSSDRSISRGVSPACDAAGLQGAGTDAIGRERSASGIAAMPEGSLPAGPQSGGASTGPSGAVTGTSARTSSGHTTAPGLPATDCAPAPTTSAPGQATSVPAPTTSAGAPTTSALGPINSAPGQAMSARGPTTSAVAPISSAVAPPISAAAPTTSAVAPSTSAIPAATSAVPPTTSAVPPTTSAPGLAANRPGTVGRTRDPRRTVSGNTDSGQGRESLGKTPSEEASSVQRPIDAGPSQAQAQLVPTGFSSGQGQGGGLRPVGSGDAARAVHAKVNGRPAIGLLRQAVIDPPAQVHVPKAAGKPPVPSQVQRHGDGRPSGPSQLPVAANQQLHNREQPLATGTASQVTPTVPGQQQVQGRPSVTSQAQTQPQNNTAGANQMQPSCQANGERQHVLLPPGHAQGNGNSGHAQGNGNSGEAGQAQGNGASGRTGQESGQGDLPTATIRVLPSASFVKPSANGVALPAPAVGAGAGKPNGSGSGLAGGNGRVFIPGIGLVSSTGGAASAAGVPSSTGVAVAPPGKTISPSIGVQTATGPPASTGKAMSTVDAMLKVDWAAAASAAMNQAKAAAGQSAEGLSAASAGAALQGENPVGDALPVDQQLLRHALRIIREHDAARDSAGPANAPPGARAPADATAGQQPNTANRQLPPNAPQKPAAISQQQATAVANAVMAWQGQNAQAAVTGLKRERPESAAASLAAAAAGGLNDTAMAAADADAVAAAGVAGAEAIDGQAKRPRSLTPTATLVAPFMDGSIRANNNRAGLEGSTQQHPHGNAYALQAHGSAGVQRGGYDNGMQQQPQHTHQRTAAMS